MPVDEQNVRFKKRNKTTFFPFYKGGHNHSLVSPATGLKSKGNPLTQEEASCPLPPNQFRCSRFTVNWLGNADRLNLIAANYAWTINLESKVIKQSNCLRRFWVVSLGKLMMNKEGSRSRESEYFHWNQTWPSDVASIYNPYIFI